MGIDYSYVIHAHRRDSRRFVEALTEVCDRDHDRSTTALLPDGSAAKLPGTHRFVNGRTVPLTDPSFELVVDFPPDVGRMGYVYLSVFDASALLPEHLAFHLTPATSAQSRVFLSAPVVRRTVVSLARAVSSPLCRLDVEEAFHIVVTAGDREFGTPGPLWDRRAPRGEAYGELMSGRRAARWIVWPRDARQEAFHADLARHSRPPDAVSSGGAQAP